MESESERIPLVDGSQELRRLCGQTMPYNVLWRAIVEGAVPAERIRGRWYLKRADLPRIAETLGIRPAA